MDIRTDSVDDVLEHYGIKRRSGRYPWGSGDRPYQNSSKHSGDYALNRTIGSKNSIIYAIAMNVHLHWEKDFMKKLSEEKKNLMLLIAPKLNIQTHVGVEMIYQK